MKKLVSVFLLSLNMACAHAYLVKQTYEADNRGGVVQFDDGGQDKAMTLARQSCGGGEPIVQGIETQSYNAGYQRGYFGGITTLYKQTNYMKFKCL